MILTYVAAKLFELEDHQLYALTGGTVAGHTLKHIVAAFAAWPVIAALAARRDERQNWRRVAAQQGRSDPLGDA